MKPIEHQWHNRLAWERLAKQQNRLATPARDEDFANPLKSVDSQGWLGPDVCGKSVLCLAAGGGRQGPLYAAAGALVTVVDLSPAMLDLDVAIARKRKLNLKTIHASMEDLSALADATFDIVVHPVSTCYVPNVTPVYKEVARVLRVGGIYISQHKQPTSLQSTLSPSKGRFQIEHSYYTDRPLPAAAKSNLVREEGTLEFLHRWEELVGAMCRAGMVIEDLTEPMHAKWTNETDGQLDSFAYRSQYIAPYVRIKARRIESTTVPPRRVWIPGQSS